MSRPAAGPQDAREAPFEDERGDQAADGAGQTASPFVTRADVVVVPPDEETAGRDALAADESLSEETLEDLMEGAPPAMEEMVHEQLPLDDVLLDEGGSEEVAPAEDVELAWTDPTEDERPSRDGRD